MQKPQIELRRIEYSARLSEETSAYAADVYVNGELFCYVKNDGRGGCDSLYPAKGKTHADIHALDKLIAATFPAYPLGGGLEPATATLELVCGDLLEHHLIAKEVKRALKSRVLIAEGRTLRQSAKLKPEQMPAAIAAFKAKYPHAEILNELPPEKQIERYRALT